MKSLIIATNNPGKRAELAAILAPIECIPQSEKAISQWYEQNRIYDGTGTPKLFSDFAIINCFVFIAIQG